MSVDISRTQWLNWIKDGLWMSSDESRMPNKSSLSEKYNELPLLTLSGKYGFRAKNEQTSIHPASILRNTNRSKSFPPNRKCSGKKVVRFADSLGLELENVRHLIMSDLPPYVPSRAFADLHQVENSLELEADFQNPSSLIDFDFRLQKQSVCLHSVRPTYTTVYGLIKVLNLTFRKEVLVRYSTNGWRTFNDLSASYVPDSNDGNQDAFSFNVFTNPSDFSGMRELKLFFAVCYKTEDGYEFWDNNSGQNYALSGYYKPVTTKAHYRHSWVHFL